jgi:Raf kinase inhibitor-like YbhB/YbcL family protein
MTDPYARLPVVPSFALASDDVAEGGPLPASAYAAASGLDGAADRSPQLSWSGFPPGTASFVVTMFDPDAPPPSGFWHWAVADLPASVTGLPGGVREAALPAPAFHVSNDVRAQAYVGAAPPPGTGRHRYVLAVSALSVPSVRDLGVTPDSTPAALTFLTAGHTIARAVLTGWGGGD